MRSSVQCYRIIIRRGAENKRILDGMRDVTIKLPRVILRVTMLNNCVNGSQRLHTSGRQDGAPLADGRELSPLCEGRRPSNI